MPSSVAHGFLSLAVPEALSLSPLEARYSGNKLFLLLASCFTCALLAVLWGAILLGRFSEDMNQK